MRKLLIGAAVAAVTVVAFPSVVSAFNPAEYTGNGKPQFNVYSNADGYGDERDFVRVGGKNSPQGALYTSEYEACDGEATIAMYVHNGAPEGFNGTNNDGTGVAKNTRVRVSLPSTSKGSITGYVSADNATPQIVQDGAKITCNGEEVSYELVPGSVQLFSLDRGAVALNSDQGKAIVSSAGLQIGSEKADGIVPGCWNDRVYVKMTVKINKIVKTPKYTCNLLTPITIDRNKYKFTAKASVENATVQSYTFDFGGNGENQTVTTSAKEATSKEVTFTKDSTVKVTVNFTVPGSDKPVAAPANDKCVVQIKLNQPPVVPPVTPPVPTTIVETGAGSTIGIFSAVTALAYGFKRWFDSRRGLSKV